MFEVQSLDVNMVTNSLKTTHVDYIVLMRKLSQFMDQNSPNTDIETLRQSRIIEQVKEFGGSKEVTIHFEVDNGMRIKNPLSSCEAPNAFVYMKPSFRVKEDDQFVQTSDIKSNSYPTWNYKSQNFTMALDEANRQFLEGGSSLEFEVFHRATGASNNFNVTESNHLIGVAFVPLSGLIQGNGKTRLTGLYDVVPKGTVFNQSMSSLKAAEPTMGRIKVCVSTSHNIKSLLDDNPTTISSQGQSNQALSNNFESYTQSVRNTSFGEGYRHNPYPS